MRDLSEQGARLEVSDSAVLPPRFTLFVPKQGRRYDATMRWHRDGQAGVEFGIPAATDQKGGGPADERVARLEGEVARLRRVIEAIRADPSQARLLLERFDSGTHAV